MDTYYEKLEKAKKRIVKVAGIYHYARENLGAIILYVADEFDLDPQALDDEIRPIIDQKEVEAMQWVLEHSKLAKQ